MMNLMVYQSETYRVHALVRDVTMIGRRGLLSTEGFEFNERDTNQWNLCH
jgi:hypothetical protein